MKELLRSIKRLFGKYENNHKYYIYLKDIIIPLQFKESPPKVNKMMRKWSYYRRTGEFESKILLTRDFVLVDGYTSYIIARKQEIDKVPVYFVDNKEG